jgi:hypothetical protein
MLHATLWEFVTRHWKHNQVWCSTVTRTMEKDWTIDIKTYSSLSTSEIKLLQVLNVIAICTSKIRIVAAIWSFLSYLSRYRTNVLISSGNGYQKKLQITNSLCMCSSMNVPCSVRACGVCVWERERERALLHLFFISTIQWFGPCNCYI